MCCDDVLGMLVVHDATMLQTLLEYVHAYQHLLPPRRRPWRIDYTALIDGLLAVAPSIKPQARRSQVTFCLFKLLADCGDRVVDFSRKVRLQAGVSR